LEFALFAAQRQATRNTPTSPYQKIEQSHQRTSMSKPSDPVTFLEPFASFAAHLLDSSSVVAADDGAGQA
jgi:hypothetical protein